MATRTFSGPGADDWTPSTPLATETAEFSTASGSMTEDFAALNAVDLGAVVFKPTYVGSVGDEDSGWALQCNGEVTNSSQAPIIHLTGGDTENVERVVHTPLVNGARMILSDGTFGSAVVGTNGVLVVRGDATLSANLVAVDGGFAQIKAGSGSYPGVEATGNSQVDVYEDPATNSIDVMDRARVRVMHNTASIAANLTGGTLVMMGGEIAGLYGMAGHLDCSQATADVTLSGTKTVSPNLRITLPKPPLQLTVTDTTVFEGGRPAGWPGNYA